MKTSNKNTLSQGSATTVAPDLSVVVPAFNEAETLTRTLDNLKLVLGRLVHQFEIIVVDDGSTDSTYEIASKSDVRVLRLSRNFGKEQAIMAGLSRSKGNAVAIIDADLQENADNLVGMYERYKQGYDMVYAVRANRDDEPMAKRFFSKVFYRLLEKGSDVKIPPDARDFRIMDRKVVNALLDLPEKNRFMKGLFAWVGFRSTSFSIEIAPREEGSSKFDFRGLTQLGLTALTSFTDWPLRIWTGIGFLIAFMSFLYGTWIFAKTLIWGAETPGFATITVAIFFLGGIQLISIGIIGEYLARMFTELKDRPGFIIADEVGDE
jgi:glycosyltransferase involved in cell wall biosynthesis